MRLYDKYPEESSKTSAGVLVTVAFGVLEVLWPVLLVLVLSTLLALTTSCDDECTERVDLMDAS